MGMGTPLPRTLIEAVSYFADPDNCREYLVARRWPNGVTCPTCGSSSVYFDRSRNGWECKTRHPQRKFTLKTGTIFEDSPLPLSKWLPAVWMIANMKNGVSSWELHRAIGVTQTTAWFMLQRIRLAMQDTDTGGKLSGHIEVDETFIGGKARNMHKARRERAIKGTQGKVRENIRRTAHVYTDELLSYEGLDSDYTHKVINHAEKYVDGQIHTNGCENFWSLLKRALKGTYISVQPFHLFRYLDEQAFRFNNRREMNDADRFSEVVRNIVGRRLTYKELIAAINATSPA